MKAISEINQRIQLLPEALQEEVLQFINYLLFKKETTDSKANYGKETDSRMSAKNQVPAPEELDYKEFWGIIQPPMGLEKIDQLITEMRED